MRRLPVFQMFWMLTIVGIATLAIADDASKRSATSSNSTKSGRSRIVPAAATESAEIAWQTHPKAAFRKARAEGRPLLIVFSGKRCHWCRKLEKETLADPKIANLVNSRFIPVHLDTEEFPEYAEALEVEGLPTTVILDTEASVVSLTAGYQNASKFKKTLVVALEELEAESLPQIVPVTGSRLEKSVPKR